MPRVPSRRRARAAAAVTAIAAAAACPWTATGAPTVSAQRAEVARITAQIDRLDGEVGAAAEAYNGARYRLEQAGRKIRANRLLLNRTERELARSRALLAERLRYLYATPRPTLTEVVLTSGSLGEAADTVDLLERVGDHDGAVVEGIRGHRARLRTARAALAGDRARARGEVLEAERQKARVLGLLAERQAILRRAEGELGRLLAAERERRRRAAERERAAAAALESARSSAAPSTSPSPSPSAAPVPASPTPPPGEPRPPAAPAAPAPAAPAGGGNAAVVGIAMRYLGVPYRWGGADPSGFDCSGLASYCYAQLGITVPHYTGAIWNAFPHVSRDALQPGDMVFYRPDLGHMGIYIGGGRYIHAPQTGDVVKISSMADRSDYQGAVRP